MSNYYSTTIDFKIIGFLHRSIIFKALHDGDSKIHIYFNTKLIVLHNISDKKLNYEKGHYESILSMNYKGKSDDDIKDMAKNNLKLIGEIYGK